MTTLVYGAGGLTGGAAVEALAAAGHQVRALVHREETIPDVRSRGAVEARVVDYDDESAIAAATIGADAVYFVAPTYATAEPRWIAGALQAAAEAGASRFVYHSVLHPYTPTMPHHRRKAEAEVAVRSSELRWSIVQPAMYAQTLLRMRTRSEPGTIAVPYSPEAPFSVVDIVDVAGCVAAMIGEDQHVYGCYEIAGPRTQTFAELAADMNRAFGEARRPRRVEPDAVRLPDEWNHRQQREYAAMCREYDAHGLTGSGAIAEMLLRRPPATFADVVAREAPGVRDR